MYLPKAYTINLGTACGMAESFAKLNGFEGSNQLFKLRMEKNLLKDEGFASILLGLRMRPEFYSVSIT